MNATGKVQSVIENTFVNAIEKLTKDSSGHLVSDIYVLVDKESGELQVCDDTEKVLAKTVIFDWVDSKDNEEVFNKRVGATLKAVLAILSSKEAFDNPRFMKPLSISFTDDEFTVIEELLFLDDEVYRLDDPLLKDLDAELDDFLAKLLSDIE